MAFPDALVFATDFSHRCEPPLASAVELARLWKCRLILMHVDEGPAGDGQAEIAERLRALVADEDMRIETVVETGPVAPAIARVAAETGAGLIVTGPGRREDAGDFFLGTNVDRLVREVAVPVLVVKRGVPGEYRQVLVASDFSSGSAAAVEVATAFFPSAALTMVHAYHVALDGIRGREAGAPALQARIAGEVADFYDRLEIERDRLDAIDLQVDYGDAVDVVRETADAIEAELVVLGTHGKSGFIAATIGSKAKALLESLPIDVLLIPRKLSAAG